MKKTSFKYFLLIITAVFFSIKTSAQAVPDPGGDPLKSDSTKEITAIQTGATISLNVSRDFLSEGKNDLNFSKRSDTLFLGKNDEEKVRTSLK